MERRPELDFMRAFVVAGLVVFHSAIVFTTAGSWFVNDPRPSPGFDVFVLWGMTWGMPLLFVVSGMGVRHALRTRSARVFLRERVLRLLVPFVVGMLALVPPMFYVGRLGKAGFHESYGHFWLRFLDAPALAGGLLSRGVWSSGSDQFDPAHLWFLYVLLLLSIALLPVFLYLRRPAGTQLIDRIAKAAERHPLAMLLTGAVPMGLVEAVFGPDKVTGGWERLAYLFPLLFGYVIGSNRRFERALRHERRRALACAVLSTALLVWWAGLTGFDDIVAGDVPGWGAVQGLAGWAWIMAILGFAGSWIARPQRQALEGGPAAGRPTLRLSRAARYANQAVLPFYVLHEPVIVGAAWIIVRWQAPIPAKYFVLVLVSLAGTLALYQLVVRRWPVTRLLFGMKEPDRRLRTEHGWQRSAQRRDRCYRAS
ncbi:MAG TPA: acyltransferase [Actinomycetes bacterium]|jgi:peptidoglycan/LPS O-acetylase OafA/YrhL|nr:acyltransferase [Actinomycetes bacterium]